MKKQNLQQKKISKQSNKPTISKKFPQEGNNEIQDDRFKIIQFDPRFKQKQKQKLKTKLDNRFSSILKNKDYQITSKFDKYGRKIKASDKNKEFEKHYYVNEEDENEHENQSQDNEESSEGSSGLGRKKNLQKLKKQQKDLNENQEKQQKLFDEEGRFQWNEVSSSEENAESELEDEDIQNLVQQEEIEEMWDSEDDKQQIQEFEGNTNILALQNFDWTQLKSQDLMLLFNSFKPTDGVIKKVTIYPSEYGLQEMKKEQQFGPQNIWKDQNSQENVKQQEEDIIEKESSENSDADQDILNKKQKRKFKSEKEINEWIAKEGKDENDLDINKLRKYEKNRLRYYYAIIECDTTQTAEHIYLAMDGLEFELTAMKVDLRYVPKNQKFPHDPIDACTQIPTNYITNCFLNRALNHTNVKLTWEEPNLNRFDHLLKKKKLTPEDLELSYLANYIGSDIEDEDDDQKRKKNKMKDDEDFDGVIEDSDIEDEIIVEDKNYEKNDADGNDDWRQDFNKKRKNRNNMDMEITFSTGFNDLGNKILEKQKEKENQETPWEKYLRKKKEKKLERKRLYKNGGKNQYKTDDDYFVEPPSTENQNAEADDDQEKEKSQKMKQKQREKDELELLLFDVNKAPKSSATIDKKFKVNVNDERFSAIYQNKSYAIDPTDKHFQNNNDANNAIFNEQVQRRKKINSQKI